MPCDPEDPTGDLPPSAFEHLFGARFDAASRERAYPSVIGDYETLGVIGTGGNGVVLKARHRRTGREAALKIIRPDCCTPEGLARFEIEWRTLAELKHRNIATILDCGWYESRAGRAPYYVMELIEGRQGSRPSDVCEYARRKGLSLEQRMGLLADLCGAMQHAHDKGTIHRDLKPGNIPVDESNNGESNHERLDTPKVVDFGLSHVLGAAIVRPSAATPRNEIAGTLRYMAPEQVRGDVHAIGTWTDVHALGLIGYELATGRLPYDIDHLSEMEAIQHIQTAPRWPASDLAGGADKGLSDVLAAAVAPGKQERTKTARDFGRELENWIVARLRRSRLFATCLAALLGACVLLAGYGVTRWLAPVLLGTLDLGAPYERWLAQMPPAAALAPLKDVRVIALDVEFNDPAVLDRAAKALGLESLSATRVDGLRPLYGRVARAVIERGGAASVALDIGFKNSSEFDASFVQDVGAINERAKSLAVPAIVVGMPMSSFDAKGVPVFMSPELARASPFVGNMYGVFDSDAMWSVELLGRYDGSATVASLAAMLYAKSRPGAGLPGFTMGDQSTASRVVLGPRIGSAPGAELTLPPAPVGLTMLDPSEVGPGAPTTYEVAQFRFVLPDRPTLRNATVTMQDVVEAIALGDEGTVRLHAWFDQRAVVIGDIRDKRSDGEQPDIKQSPDGRDVAGVYAHAVVTQWLMDGRGTRLPSDAVESILTFGMCAVGVAVVWGAIRWARVRDRAWLAILIGPVGLLLVGAAWIASCLIAFRSGLWLVYPWVPLAGMVVAALLATVTLVLWRSGLRAGVKKGAFA